MRIDFQEQQREFIDDKSIKADYLFTFFPVYCPPIKIPAQITIAIPDQDLLSFVSLEDAIEALLRGTATTKLEELEKAFPGYLMQPCKISNRNSTSIHQGQLYRQHILV